MNAPALWIGGPSCAEALDLDALSPEERDKGAAIATDAHRLDWRASRALLQRAAPPANAPVSLSHSRGHAAVFVGAPGTRIGVDLETATRRRWQELAMFAFHPDEAREYTGTDATQRREFLIRWTLKESCVKALRLPLLDALRRCVFTRDAAGRWRGEVPTSQPWSAAVWSAYETGIVGAIAIAADGDPDPPRIPAPIAWPETPVVELVRIESAR
jgi:phosphopantetheinyl transferase